MSCLTWRFLAIAMASKDIFAREFVALGAEFCSTLTSVEQCAHVTPNAVATIAFQHEEAFTRLHLVTGRRVRGGRAENQQMNKFSQCAIGTLKISVLLLYRYSANLELLSVFMALA